MSRFRLVLALFLLLVLLVLLVLWIDSPHGGSPPADPQLASSDPSDRVVPVADGPPGAERALGARSVEATGRREVASGRERPVQPWPKEGFDLQIQDAATGLPVAAAQVDYFEQGDERTRELLQEWILEGPDPLPARLDAAQRFESDARGHVRVPFPRLLGVVAVRSGELRGHLLISGLLPRHPLGVDIPERIELHPLEAVPVEIVDQDGVPRPGHELILGPNPWFHGAWQLRGHVDGRGRAVLFHSRTLLPQLCSKGLLQVGVLDFRGRGLLTPVDPLALKLDGFGNVLPIRVYAPRGGRVDVLVTDLQGLALADQVTRIYLDVETRDDVVEVQADCKGPLGVSFEDLPSGSRFSVAARRASWRDSWGFEGSVTGIVPEPGERLTVELAVDQVKALVVRGRFVDSEGLPCGDLDVRVGVHAAAPATADDDTPPEGYSSNHSLRSDSLGGFRLHLPGAIVGLARVPGFSMGLDVSSMDEVGSLLVANQEWNPDALAGEELELGDVCLERPGLLVEGVVVDPTGAPIRGANVGAMVGQRVPKGSGQEPGVEKVGWRSDIEITSSAADGTFVLRGTEPEGILCVQATKTGYRGPRWVPLLEGERWIRLELVPKGSITGSLILPEGVPSDRVEVGIRRSFAEWEAGRANGTAHEPGFEHSLSRGANGLFLTAVDESAGRFRWHDLDPGNYRISVHIAGSEEPLVSFEDVVVLAGSETRDVRLQRIDVAAFARVLSVDVRDPEGQPIPSGRMVISREGERIGEGAFENGAALLLVSGLPIRLGFKAPGMADQEVLVTSPEVEVVLEPGIMVQFVLQDGVSLPAGAELGIYLYLLAADGEYAGSGWGTYLELEPSGTVASGRLGCSGRFEVEIQLLRLGFGEAVAAAVEAPSSGLTIEVQAQHGPQVFSLEIDQAAIDAAVAETEEQ